EAVPGARRPARREGADEKQGDVPGVDVGAGADRGEPRRPPARHQQEPGADWPVETGEPQVGTRPGRSEAVDPVAGRIGDAPGAAGPRASGLPVSVSKVPCPFFVAVAESGTVGVVPRGSLRLGPAGRGPWAAASQTFLPTCAAFSCEALTCLRTSGGTPQVALFCSRPFSILLSEERKVL